MNGKLALAAIAAFATPACTAVKSSHVDYVTGANHNGLHYAMPKALFRVEIVSAGTDLHLRISEPFYVGDTEASYVMNASSGFLADQEYLFVVQPQTRLLTYINSESEGKAGDILVNAVKSAAGGYTMDEYGVRGGYSDAAPERVVFSRIVDPFAYPGCDFGTVCDFEPLTLQLNQAARMALNCSVPGRVVNETLCNAIAADPRYFDIRLEPLFSAAPLASARQRRGADDCTRSICYRAPAPYNLALRVANTTDVAEIVSLPNEAPVIALSIPAGVFADARARVELYQGMPARYVVDRNNELVAVTLLPFKLIEAGFNAVGQVLKFRIDYNNTRAQQLDSEATREEAESRRTTYENGLIGDNLGVRAYSDESSASPMQDSYGSNGSQTTTIGAGDVTAGVPGPSGQMFDIVIHGGESFAAFRSQSPQIDGQSLSQEPSGATP
ncbi:MAG: hypothetical protein R3C52_03850 [Hyphomonadaceae bacterium]